MNTRKLIGGRGGGWMRYNRLVEQAQKRKVVLVLIEKDGKFVLVRKRQPTLITNLEWAFPGGVTEEGEDESLAAVREAKQEVGMDVEVVKKIFERRHEKILINLAYFHCKPLNPAQLPVVGEPDELSEVEWVAADEVLKKFTSDVHPVIRDFVLAHAKK